jgi:hypothetical protein
VPIIPLAEPEPTKTEPCELPKKEEEIETISEIEEPEEFKHSNEP